MRSRFHFATFVDGGSKQDFDASFDFAQPSIESEFALILGRAERAKKPLVDQPPVLSTAKLTVFSVLT